MSVPRRLSGAAAVLVVRESAASGEDPWEPFPTELVTESPTSLDVVVVSGRPVLARWLSAWRERHSEFGGRLCTITVGGEFGGGRDRPDAAARLSVEGVDGPGELTEQGSLVDEYLKAWTGTDRRTLVVHTATTEMLQYVDLSTLFRFVVVLRACLRNADAMGAFYVDPDAHDQRVIGTLREAFDAVVRVDDEGTRVQYA